MKNIRLLGTVLSFMVGLQSHAQDTTINNYPYTYLSIDKSPKEALRAATKEALVMCLQENTQTLIQSVTLMRRFESDRIAKEAYFNQLLESTLGIIKSYSITDTSQTLDRDGVLRTKLRMNVSIMKKGNDNPMGLAATLDRSEYGNGETGKITAQTMSAAWLYIFDVVSSGGYNLIYAPNDIQPAGKQLIFPDERFDLVMEKSVQQPVEFGSLLVIASPEPIDFAENTKPLYMEPVTITLERFQRRLASLSKPYSMAYLPYAIE